MVAEKKEKGVEVYTLSGMAKLKGFIKNGLDTSTMVNIIVNFDLSLKSSNKEDLLFRRIYSFIMSSLGLKRLAF